MLELPGATVVPEIAPVLGKWDTKTQVLINNKSYGVCGKRHQTSLQAWVGLSHHAPVRPDCRPPLPLLGHQGSPLESDSDINY